MTMQVGMVGTDGIVLASDTLWTQSPMSGSEGARHSYSSHKIRIFKERGVAISSARDMETANFVADRIAADPRLDEYPADRKFLIEEIGNECLEKVGDRNEAQCLILFHNPKPSLFAFEYAIVNRKHGPWCGKIIDGAVHTGDTVNAATFWSERYCHLAPVRALVPLAAHLIVSAGKLNPAVIRGLEIVLCQADGFHRLSDESISNLVSKSNEWDDKIGELILGYSPELSYAL
jgi:hypothetical protein